MPNATAIFYCEDMTEKCGFDVIFIDFMS